jgi:hypothetical protein
MNNPLDVGAVIDRVFAIYVDQAPVLMPAAAVVFALSGILTAVLVAAGPGLTLLGALISLVATTLFTGMVVQLVADVRDGHRDASATQLLQSVTPVLGQLVLVGIVVGAAVLVGFILLVIPGLIVLTIWSVSAPVVVLERPGGLKALGRSRELVRGNGWRVFGVVSVFILLVLVVGVPLELLADALGTGAGIIVRVVVGVLTAPLSALAAAVLYFELRGPPHPDPAAGGPDAAATGPDPAPTGPDAAGSDPDAAATGPDAAGTDPDPAATGPDAAGTEPDAEGTDPGATAG